LLETKEFTEAHATINIAEEMRSVISEWELDMIDLIAATTDNASSIKAITAVRMSPHAMFQPRT